MNPTPRNIFRLPDLGEGLTEAVLIRWLIAVGDPVATDQVIAEVETAKSIVELPSPFAGTVAALHGAEGATITVGAPIFEVHSGATTRSEADPVIARLGTSDTDATPPTAHGASGNVLIGYGTAPTTAAGRRRRPAHPHATPTAQAAAPTPSSATPSSASPQPVAVRSPIVRRLARELGVDTHTIRPTGHDGAVTRADVLRSASTAGEHLEGLAVVAREPLSPFRKAVSATLSRSRSEIPEATVWVDVDATPLWNLRHQMAPTGGTAPSLTALLARYVLLALAEYPLLAARLSDDGGTLTRFDGVNLGIAADTPRGLMVPVIPRAHDRTLTELDRELRELATAARADALTPTQLRGSTFTLNNYGGFGVDGSAAIINHPEVAILGIGRIMERPWVVDAAIVPRRIAQLSLVFDHRVCDGGYASGFLRHVVDAIEQPLRMYGNI